MLDFNPQPEEIVTMSVTAGIMVVMLVGWMTKKIAGIFFWIVAILCVGELIYSLATGGTLRLR